jgi:hypothetical protein
MYFVTVPTAAVTLSVVAVVSLAGALDGATAVRGAARALAEAELLEESAGDRRTGAAAVAGGSWVPRRPRAASSMSA